MSARGVKRSKAAAFAKAWRELSPKDLVLRIDERMSDGKRNPNGVTFLVNVDGKLVIENWPFSPKDALRLAAWIQENFR